MSVNREQPVCTLQGAMRLAAERMSVPVSLALGILQAATETEYGVRGLVAALNADTPIPPTASAPEVIRGFQAEMAQFAQRLARHRGDWLEAVREYAREQRRVVPAPSEDERAAFVYRAIELAGYMQGARYEAGVEH